MESIMQAISTRFFGPTNHRGARVVAKCQARRLAVSWDYALGVQGNHDAACKALVQLMGWAHDGTNGYGPWHGGGTPDGSGYTYVCVTCYSEPVA